VNPNYPTVARRAGHRCEYCRAPEVAFNLAFEVEHIHPSAHGGGTAGANLALGCRSCNLHKAAQMAGTDPRSGEVVPPFHPRNDQWNEHFALGADAAIIGLTSTGRATIDALRMNSPKQLVARQQWKILKLFE
jgi:hypothetical protein